MATRLLAALVFSLMSSSVFSMEVSGINIPDADQQLVLNGAGLRKVVFFRVYAIGLYLPEKKASPADAIGTRAPSAC